MGETDIFDDQATGTRHSSTTRRFYSRGPWLKPQSSYRLSWLKLSWFPSVLLDEFLDNTLKYTTTASFQILMYSSLKIFPPHPYLQTTHRLTHSHPPLTISPSLSTRHSRSSHPILTYSPLMIFPSHTYPI